MIFLWSKCCLQDFLMPNRFDVMCNPGSLSSGAGLPFMGIIDPWWRPNVIFRWSTNVQPAGQSHQSVHYKPFTISAQTLRSLLVYLTKCRKPKLGLPILTIIVRLHDQGATIIYPTVFFLVLFCEQKGFFIRLPSLTLLISLFILLCHLENGCLFRSSSEYLGMYSPSEVNLFLCFSGF